MLHFGLAQSLCNSSILNILLEFSLSNSFLAFGSTGPFLTISCLNRLGEYVPLEWLTDEAYTF
jgi:hypothetical protein